MQTNLGNLLRQRAQLSPQIEALVEAESGRRFHYAELNERCNRTANALQDSGVRPGERVGCLLMNSVEYIETFFATAKLGAVSVPMNWRLTPEELDFIAKDAGITALVYDAEFDAAVAALHERALDVRHWIRVGDAVAKPDWALSYTALTIPASTNEPALAGGNEDPLYIMYTSGTTGFPKGAVHTHKSALAVTIALAFSADLRYRDRYLQILPLFHVGGLTPAITHLLRGATLVMPRSFNPQLIFSTLERESITTTGAVPAMLEFMWAVLERSQYNLSALRWIACGAAPVPVSLIEKYAAAGIEIQQVYGLTECGGFACMISPELALVKAGSTGPALLHTEVRIADEMGRDAAPGEVGEILVRGEHLMKEYWNQPRASAETLRGGWLYTGDLATWDAAGFVYVQDRKKDMIISGGENIYPAEIEKILAGHPKLQDVAVIGTPSPKWGESPLAVVVVKESQQVTAEEVIAFCRGKLANYKIPKIVEFAAAIPRNSTGKILKNQLRKRFPGPAPE